MPVAPAVARRSHSYDVIPAIGDAITTVAHPITLVTSAATSLRWIPYHVNKRFIMRSVSFT